MCLSSLQHMWIIIFDISCENMDQRPVYLDTQFSDGLEQSCFFFKKIKKMNAKM
jgi:hypothetical protein